MPSASFCLINSLGRCGVFAVVGATVTVAGALGVATGASVWAAALMIAPMAPVRCFESTQSCTFATADGNSV